MEDMEKMNAENAENQQPDAAPDQAPDEPAKTFSQEEVDAIVQKRIARERERINGLINEDAEIKQQLATERIKFEVAKQLNTEGYPPEVVELLDCSSEAACKDSFQKVKGIFDKLLDAKIQQQFKDAGRNPSKGGISHPSIDDKIKAAFSPQNRR